uniref:Uncharacterized protein n=1 Tax=viral metagenome TaxID=1070528 RepID=A0A6C0IS75_9ZZZZ
MDFLFNLLNLGSLSLQTNKKHKVNLAGAFIVPININGDMNVSDIDSSAGLDVLLFHPNKKSVANDNNNNK